MSLNEVQEQMYERYLREYDYERLWPIISSIKDCHSNEYGGCPLKEYPHCLYRGNIYARIALVGQCPGKTEVFPGREMPWAGPAGQELERAFNSIGINSEEDVFISNIVKGRPIAIEGSGKENEDPDQIAVGFCKKFVLKELESLPGLKVILTAGLIASRNLGVADKNESMAKICGRLRMINIGGKDIPAIPFYHLASLLHNKDPEFIRNTKWKIRKALEQAKEIANQNW